MIGAMRKNRKILAIILWLVIIAFVSTIFVVWGIGTKENLSMYAAKVGGETITFDEYRLAYDQKLAALRQILGDDFASKQNDSAEFPLVVLNDIIDTKLVLKEADRLGIPATNFEMIEAIRSIPAFQTDGAFNPEAYKEVLRANRQTPAYFEQNLRNSIKVDKFKNMVKNSQYAVSSEAVTNEYMYRNTKAEAEYFAVPVNDFLSQITVTPDNISAYYEKNKESYRIPAKIKLKYLVFDKSKFADNATVSDDAVEEYYNNNLASFSRPETIDIRNIAVVVKNASDPQEQMEAKAKLDKALVELKNGAKFADMVEKYSDSTFKVNGGLISNILPEQMQKDMAEAVAALKEGQYSDIVKTDGGYLIIYLEKRIPAKVSTLSEVKNEIVAKLKDQRLSADYRKYVYDLYKDILKDGNITAYMKEKPETALNVMETPVFSESADVLEVFRSQPDAKAKIFSLSKTDMSQVITDGDKTYFFEVSEKEDSFIPLLDVVMNQVTEAYKAEEASKLAETKVMEAMKADGFDKAAASFNAKIVTTKPFLRKDTASDFANYSDLVAAVFKAKAGQTLDKAYLAGTSVYGVKVKALNKPSMDNFASEKDAIESYIRSTKEEAALKAYVDYLRSQTEIHISDSFMQNIVDQRKK